MKSAPGQESRLTPGRLLRWTAVLAPIVLLAIVAIVWIESVVSGVAYWRAAVAFLIGLEIAYILAAAVSIPGVVGLAILLARTPRGRPSRWTIARGLLFCGALVVSIAMAETVAAIRVAHSPGDPIARPPDPFQQAYEMPGQAADADISLRTDFPDPPGDRTIEIAVLGGSSAEGVPYNFWVSIGEIVAWQLREVFPGRPVGLQVLATSGDSLASQHRRLADFLARRPDLMIVYSGHNEFSSRFQPAREPRYYLDADDPTPLETLVSRLEAASPLCGLIRRTTDRCRIAIPPPPGGHRALVDVPAFTADERRALVDDFRRRLETIVSYSEKIGALPMLISPPANDSGFEPNRSYLSAETPRSERLAFERDFLAARRLEVQDPEAARAAYLALLDRQPGFAEAHYRLSQLLDRAGDFEGAYRHAVAARDGDGYPMRCPTDFQEVYREVASRHRSSLYLDGQAYFHGIGRRGLLDEGLFHDGMHPSFRGQMAIAQAILRALHARRAFGWPAEAPAPTIDPARCADRFQIGSAVWRRICLWGIMFYDRTWPLRYDPSYRQEKKRVFAEAVERIEAGEAPESLGLPNIGTPEPVPALDVIPVIETRSLPSR